MPLTEIFVSRIPQLTGAKDTEAGDQQKQTGSLSNENQTTRLSATVPLGCV